MLQCYSKNTYIAGKNFADLKNLRFSMVFIIMLSIMHFVETYMFDAVTL